MTIIEASYWLIRGKCSLWLAYNNHSALSSLSSDHNHQQNGKFYNRPVNYGPYTSTNRVRESNYFPRDIGYTYENIHQQAPGGPSKNSQVITSGNTLGPQDHYLHQNSLSTFIASHGPGLGSANLMQTPSLNIASPPGKLLTNREAALSTSSGLLIGKLSTLLVFLLVNTDTMSTQSKLQWSGRGHIYTGGDWGKWKFLQSTPHGDTRKY